MLVINQLEAFAHKAPRGYPPGAYGNYQITP